MLKSKNAKKYITLILMILSLNTIYQLPYLMYSTTTPRFRKLWVWLAATPTTALC